MCCAWLQFTNSLRQYSSEHHWYVMGLFYAQYAHLWVRVPFPRSRSIRLQVCVVGFGQLGHGCSTCVHACERLSLPSSQHHLALGTCVCLPGSIAMSYSCCAMCLLVGPSHLEYAVRQWAQLL